MSYEFNREDSKVFLNFSMLSIITGSIIVVFTIINLIGAPKDPDYANNVGVTVIRYITGVFEIGVGLYFILPSMNFRRIATTEGSDITELISGVQKLTNGYKMIVYLIVADLILTLIQAILVAVA